MSGFTILDYLALSWYLLCWFGYSHLADHPRWYEQSVRAAMNALRRRWMLTMLRRDPRMLDALIQASLLTGSTFFASTSILLVGGMLAILGATEQAIAILGELPFTPVMTRAVWEIKVLLLVVIFVYAFFKFAWCYRLFTYCSVLLGAAPLPEQLDDKAEAHAEHMAELHGLAAEHFNSGIRAYFFALAALCWFLHPLIFILATAWVTWVVYRREFRSRSNQILQKASAGEQQDGPPGV